MDVPRLLLAVCFVYALSLVFGITSLAADAKELPPGMTPEKLEKTVKRRFDYIDKRLLAGKSAKSIEESGNQRALEILQQSRKNRDEIAAWIDKGNFESAYWALQDLARSIKEALQLSRAKQRDAKKLKDDMDSARIANDAYFELVRKRGIADAGGEVAALVEQARKIRAEADNLRNNNDYAGATERFLDSTGLLKKAASLFRSMAR